MKRIQLGGNRFWNHPVRAYALVDDEDFENLSKNPWCLSSSGYAIGRDWRDKKERKMRMHREVLGCADKNVFVDHIDGNKLNNQKSNLRLANKSQNAANSKIPSNNKSGFKGVYFEKYTKKWRAEIAVNGIKNKLGRFARIEDAASVYKNAALKYFGEYARIN